MHLRHAMHASALGGVWRLQDLQDTDALINASHGGMGHGRAHLSWTQQRHVKARLLNAT